MLQGIYRVLLLFILFSVFWFSPVVGQSKFEENRISVAMRTIGHELLLLSNDSTSTIKVIESKDDFYSIQISNYFQFKPFQLVAIVDSIFRKKKISKQYFVQVIDLKTKEIIYNYEVDSFTNLAEIPCAKRMPDTSFYEIQIHILDKTKLDSIDIAKAKRESNINLYLLICLFILFLLLLFWFVRKSKKSKEISPPINTDFISIGKFKFDRNNAVLWFQNQEIILSVKEADLLFLLYSNANVILERELILNKIWGDEGDYIGRTLDVFISKLRKKIELDNNLKIVNHRGVGYKLIVNSTLE
jgi:DNA-binding winged helix-turn-helix (wHTH) protein